MSPAIPARVQSGPQAGSHLSCRFDSSVPQPHGGAVHPSSSSPCSLRSGFPPPRSCFLCEAPSGRPHPDPHSGAPLPCPALSALTTLSLSISHTASWCVFPLSWLVYLLLAWYRVGCFCDSSPQHRALLSLKCSVFVLWEKDNAQRVIEFDAQ